MKSFILRRIEAILHRPDTWGPPRAVELQVLLLVEMWHVVAGASKDRVDDTHIRYDQYLDSVLPANCFDLTGKLGLTNRASDQFVDLLRNFVKQEELPVDTQKG